MNEQEQSEIAAMRQAYEQTIANLSHEHANLAAQCGAMAHKIKALEAEITSLKQPTEKPPEP